MGFDQLKGFSLLVSILLVVHGKINILTCLSVSAGDRLIMLSQKKVDKYV